MVPVVCGGEAKLHQGQVHLHSFVQAQLCLFPCITVQLEFNSCAAYRTLAHHAKHPLRRHLLMSRLLLLGRSSVSA